ncbi:zinc ribbon domain-containing protein [Halochromatium salexigens]|uniref:Putative zinc-ribbon domain-containing protein n=1 Tax=Halochromatium salexigens TaxID=49447 RepID=A0AAJ0UCV9_HALSE|nr:zinc ribbon domain-containing protein [Halochromatium salexigens]MBK5929201.1 hypothetical protein [Halochromatium salexigens]
MALIDCPECGGQVSDRAPTCPHCGVPIANSANASIGAKSEQRTQTATAPMNTAEPAASNTVDASDSSLHETVEPFKLRLAGRPIPIAGILFWGGMVVGIIMRYMFPPEPDAELEIWRRVPWLMIWAGVLWFAVTEFGALIKNKLSKQR